MKAKYSPCPLVPPPLERLAPKDIRSIDDAHEEYPLPFIRRRDWLAEEDDFYLVGDRPRAGMCWQAVAAGIFGSLVVGLCVFQLVRLWRQL